MMTYEEFNKLMNEYRVDYDLQGWDDLLWKHSYEILNLYEMHKYYLL